MDRYNTELERNFLEAVKQKEEADKRLLASEWYIVGLPLVMYLVLTFFAAFVEPEWLQAVMVVVGVIPILIGAFYSLKIEQTAGYYECAVCRHRYVPTFRSVLWAAHMGRTRHMRCPQCGEKSWQKKVLTKE